MPQWREEKQVSSLKHPLSVTSIGCSNKSIISFIYTDVYKNLKIETYNIWTRENKITIQKNSGFMRFGTFPNIEKDIEKCYEDGQ